MNRRIILIAVTTLFIIFFAPGCWWSRVEISEKAIIAGVGIDNAQKEGHIKLTVQIILPGEIKAPAKEGGQGEAVWVVTTTGRSVSDNIKDLRMQSGRKCLWSHAKIIVVGEEAAKEGIDKIIDFFEREHDLRRRIWVIVARGDAKEIMEAQLKLEKIPAFGISNLVESSKHISKAAAVNLHEFIGMVSSKTTCAFAPGIEVFGKEAEKENKAGSLRLTDTGVFKNYRLKGWLDAYESRGLLWVLGKVESGIIEVKCPEEKEKLIAIEITRASSKIKPEIKDGSVTITVEVSEEGTIRDDQFTSVDYTTPEAIKCLEKGTAAIIESEINKAITKAQEFNTDVFGFGEAVYRKYPREWKKLEKEWDEIFPNLEVKINVDAKIKRVGLVSKPAKPE